MKTVVAQRDDELIAVDALSPSSFAFGVVIGRFAGFDADDRFQIELNDGAAPMQARAALDLTAADIGVPLVIAFEDGDTRRPVILGRARERRRPSQTTVTVDGQRVVLHGEREIELRCGDASLVLTRAGKVVIRGQYVVSRSRGVNKIKGAVVDIN
jgi:uncharacterized protein DUF6484